MIVLRTGIGNYKLIQNLSVLKYCKEAGIPVDCYVIDRIEDLEEETLKNKINDKRIHWFVRIETINDYHTLMIRKFGAGGKKKDEWSLRQTCDRLGVNPGNTSRYFKLLHYKEYTEIRYAPSVEEAFRRVKRLEGIK